MGMVVALLLVNKAAKQPTIVRDTLLDIIKDT